MAQMLLGPHPGKAKVARTQGVPPSCCLGRARANIHAMHAEDSLERCRRIRPTAASRGTGGLMAWPWIASAAGTCRPGSNSQLVVVTGRGT